MEKPKCGICSKVFSSGKALGGHMRAHLVTLPLPIPPPKTEPTSSFYNSTSSSENHDEEEDEMGLIYGLRNSPKRSFKNADPDEIFDSGFAIVQDQESETNEAEVTESTQKQTRKRSKRNTLKMVLALRAESKKLSSGHESVADLEQVSCVSCTSRDEDVAMCLMMLSRDVWSGSVDSVELKKPSQPTRRKGKYQCETCNKVFKSFQALGGHRNSHKKSKNWFFQENHEEEDVGVKLHECPFCYKLFRSGQALGGHKRSHFLSSSTKTTPLNSTKLGSGNGGGILVNSTKFMDHLVIDLNMPAPMEEEEAEEEEELLGVSAVSDAELTPTS